MPEGGPELDFLLGWILEDRVNSSSSPVSFYLNMGEKKNMGSFQKHPSRVLRTPASKVKRKGIGRVFQSAPRAVLAYIVLVRLNNIFSFRAIGLESFCCTIGPVHIVGKDNPH